jgi:hypothetical protein
MWNRLIIGLLTVVIVIFGPNFVLDSFGQTPVFGPEKYIRETGKLQKITKTFSVQNPEGEFTLNVQNGEGKRGRVSSAVIKLNGVHVVGPNEFNKQVDLITKPISLKQQNEISVEVRSEPGTWIIVTILGGGVPPVSPISGITINPDAIFVEEPEYVVIRATIPYDVSQGVPTVDLQRIDEYGNVIAVEGSLTDDGNLSNGDEIAGDGVFSIRKLFSSQVEERIPLQISLQQDSLTATSDPFYLDVFIHLTDAELTTILNLQANAVQNYNNLVGSIGWEAARDTVLAQIQQDPNVIQAGISESGYGIWMLYSSGVLGALDLSPSGTRGGGSLFSLSPQSSVQALASDTNEIKSRKAIVLAPFNWDFGATDDAPGIYQILNSSSCPTFDISYLLNSAVTVDVIKTLPQYGIVAITTHGDTYYKGLLSLWQEKWGWNFWFGQVVFLTGQTATAANKIVYEKDLKKGRLAITSNASGGYYAILPSFIRYYAVSTYPDSLVYIGACRSTYNDSMANAFLDSGAETYLGYSEYVNSAFAGTVGVDFFQRFIEDPTITNTGEAFISGQNDGGSPPAYFELRGSTTLEKPSADLENGGFEEGNLGAWKASGDGRVLVQLGQFSPVEGLYLGLISTGLGYTVTSGSIEQKVCLPPDTQRLEFYWNFNSEEFIEWCGSIYQDTLRVDVITDTGTQNLFYRRIDDLCGAVFPTSLYFDQSGPGCIPFPDGVGYGTGGNDCTVWSTGWQLQSIDISGIAAANQNKPVTIRFSAGDVGDSIFDSAILLDEIKITQP